VPRTSKKLLVEDAVRVRACQLRLLPMTHQQDVVVDGPQPVFFQYSTDHMRGRVVLTCGRTRGTFEVECYPNNYGRVWWFMIDGRRRRSVYCVMDAGTGRGRWGSKDQLGLDYLSRSMGWKNRLRRQRDELVRKKMDLEERKDVARWLEVTERLDAIKEELV
jgi:hypothetical protein